MAASTSCSALIGSAPWICERRRRERLAETLAPVGPQAPPAPSARCALDSASERRGALLWTTGTSGVRANLSIMSPNTCPPCLRPLHSAREGHNAFSSKLLSGTRGRGGTKPAGLVGEGSATFQQVAIIRAGRHAA